MSRIVVTEMHRPQHPTEDVDRPEPATPAEATEKAVAQGRSSASPFVLLGGVALFIWAVVAVVAAALLLLWWLG